MTAKKFDQKKHSWALLPFDAVAQVVAVLDFGAKKYGDRNWENGMRWSRMYDGALRHLTAWWRGEELDQESGLPHLAHALCCILFLMAWSLRDTMKEKFDDRPAAETPPTREDACK